MNVFQVFVWKYGLFTGLARLAVSPVSVLVTTPWRLFTTLRNMLPLLDGKWSRYGYQFGATFSVINLWYQKVFVNIDRFGRTGVSPYLGTGRFFLSKFIHYSLPSLYLQWNTGPMVPFLGMMGWLLLHGLWIGAVGPSVVAAYVGLTFVSTTFYGNIFHRQGYHALGWLFFPLGLYGYLAQGWEISAIAWFLVAVFSPTVVFLAIVVTLFHCVWTGDFMALLSLLPAMLKISTHFAPMLKDSSFIKSLKFVTNSLSMGKNGVQYRHARHGRMTLMPLEQVIYYSVTYGQFVVFLLLSGNPGTGLMVGGYLLYLFHAFAFKIVDNQHLYLLNATIGLACVLAAPMTLGTAISFWICISPLPYFLDFCTNPRTLDVVPAAAPYDMTEALGAASEFLAPVKKDERIFVAFDDPQGSYQRLFHGYRLAYELVLYAGSLQSVFVYPDTFTPFEEHVDHARLWGRDFPRVERNAGSIQADYVVVGCPEGGDLDPRWRDAGFVALTKLSWRKLHGVLNHEPVIPQPFEDWWLLRAPSGFPDRRAA